MDCRPSKVMLTRVQRVLSFVICVFCNCVLGWASFWGCKFLSLPSGFLSFWGLVLFCYKGKRVQRNVWEKNCVFHIILYLSLMQSSTSGLWFWQWLETKQMFSLCCPRGHLDLSPNGYNYCETHPCLQLVQTLHANLHNLALVCSNIYLLQLGWMIQIHAISSCWFYLIYRAVSSTIFFPLFHVVYAPFQII